MMDVNGTRSGLVAEAVRLRPIADSRFRALSLRVVSLKRTIVSLLMPILLLTRSF